MANKHHKPEEIVAKLRQVEVLEGQGMAHVDAIRETRVTEQTYYRWRKKYGGMGASANPRVVFQRLLIVTKMKRHSFVSKKFQPFFLPYIYHNNLEN